jgi:mannonate dehydratase
MSWTVIESLPVSENIKKQTGNYLEHIDNYKQSLGKCCKVRLKVVTYNLCQYWIGCVRILITSCQIKARHCILKNQPLLPLTFFYFKGPGAEKDYTEKEIEKGKRTIAIDER